MRISVRIKPSAKQDSVEKLSDREFLLHVRAPARDGKANEAVIELLSEYFNRPRSCVSIALGANGRNKVIDVN